jgi:hypothetical protein
MARGIEGKKEKGLDEAEIVRTWGAAVLRPYRTASMLQREVDFDWIDQGD